MLYHFLLAKVITNIPVVHVVVKPFFLFILIFFLKSRCIPKQLTAISDDFHRLITFLKKKQNTICFHQFKVSFFFLRLFEGQSRASDLETPV